MTTEAKAKSHYHRAFSPVLGREVRMTGSGNVAWFCCTKPETIRTIEQRATGRKTTGEALTELVKAGAKAPKKKRK